MQTIDVTGLSPEAVRAVESFVGLLRPKGEIRSPNVDDPDGWVKSLRKWAESQPTRATAFDDGRESIYNGCGE